MRWLIISAVSYIEVEIWYIVCISGILLLTVFLLEALRLIFSDNGIPFCLNEMAISVPNELCTLVLSCAVGLGATT